MNDIEIYNQPLHLYDAKEYAREHGCSTPDDGAILYFKNEYPKGIDVDNDTSVYTYDKPIGKLVGHINNGDIYLVNGKNISYYCLVKNNFENEQSVKNTVKLNESQLRKIVAECVKKVLAEDYYDDWKKKYEKKPRRGFDSDSVHRTIKMMAPQCQNPRKGFDSDSVHKVIKGMMKEGKWDISETLNMLGDIKLLSNFLQGKNEAIESSEDADTINETVRECLGQLWRIAQQFGYC